MIIWVFFLFFSLFVLFPLSHLFWQVEPLFLSAQFLTPFFNSLKLGAVVALFSTATGFFLALATSQKKIPGRKFFSAVAILPLISPPFVLALAAIFLVGRQGVLTKILFSGGETPFSIHGFWGLVLVETLAYMPTAYLVLKGVIEAIPSAMQEAALTLGASRLQTFSKILIPLSREGLASAFLLVFMESLADFGNPLILSGNYEVLAVRIYMEMTAFYNVGGASAMAILLLVPSLIAFWGERFFIKRSVAVVTGKSQSSSFDWLGSPAKTVLFLIASFFTAVVFLMYGTVLAGAFTKVWGLNFTPTLHNFYEVWRMSGKALGDSIFLAAASGPITALMGMVLAYLVVRKKFMGKRLLEMVSLFAFAVPGTVLGLSYVLAFNKPLWILPPLQGTSAIILFLFIVRNLPVGLQAGVATLNQIDKSMEEAAATLGSHGLSRFLKITLPLMAPAFFTGWAYSFVKAITAISAVVFVVSGNWNLVTVDILGLVENGELSYAAALSAILVAIVLIVLGITRFLVGMFSTKGLGGALRGVEGSS